MYHPSTSTSAAASTSASAAASSGDQIAFKKRKTGPRLVRKPQGASTFGGPVATSSSNAAASGSRCLRVASGEEDAQEGDADSAVVVKAKRRPTNPLSQSTLPAYKRPKRDGDASDDDYGFDLDDEDGSGGAGYLSKRKQVDRFGETSVSSRSRATGGATDGAAKVRDDATRHSNWDLEVDDSGKLKECSDAAVDAADGKPNNDDGVYRGAKGYSSFVPKRDDGTSSKMRSRGPIRTTTHVRSTTVMDYQPDICKDYKETGYCGFGDTCKFLHDRTDYLAGWELDLLPNSNSRRRGDLSDPEAEGDESDEEEVPFACLICRKPFMDPVVTNCGHYFCSSCAIKRYGKTTKCFACGAQTGGLFNSATKVLKRMQQAKERKAELRSERRRILGYDEEEGGGANEDDDEGEGEILQGVEIQHSDNEGGFD
ncbi:RNA-splicing factor [Thecaphora frezii]